MLKQFEQNTQEQINDFRHHLGTIKTTQLSPEEYNLLCTRITYQLDKLNDNIKEQTLKLSSKISTQLQVSTSEVNFPAIKKQSKPPSREQEKSTTFISSNKFRLIEQTREKYLQKSQSQQTVKKGKKAQLIKPGHIHTPTILPKQLRYDPLADPPPITDKDLSKGIYNLIYGGIIPRDVDISAAFKRGGELLTQTQMNIAEIDPRQVKFLTYISQPENLHKFKLDLQTKKQEVNEPRGMVPLDPDLFLTNNQEPLSMPSFRGGKKQHHRKNQETIQMLLARSKVYILQVVNCRIQEAQGDFRTFKVDYFHLWGAIKHVLSKLEEIASLYKMQRTSIDGMKVAMLGDGQTGATHLDLLGCFCNQQLARNVFKLNKKQYFGRRGILKAVTKIQSFLKMFHAKWNYRKMQMRILKVIRIQKQYRLMQMYKNTVFRIQQQMSKVMTNQNQRQEEFIKNWSTIKQEPRIEIHIPSYSLDQFQRVTMSHFRHREALSLSRLFAIRDPTLEIIYVSPLEIDDEVIQYYWKVLEIAGIQQQQYRVHFIFPENSNRFPYSCSLTKLLYFSPKAMSEIKSIIKNRVAYLVPMRAGKEEFLVAEFLKICVFSPSVEVLNRVSTKSFAKQVFLDLGLPTSPGYTNIKTKDEFIDKLTVLIAKHLFVSRWVFKIDNEFNGRGTASFSLDGIKQFTEIRKFTEIGEEQIKKIRELVSALLPLKTIFAFNSLYTTFDEYMDEFLSKGGIIEAFPFLSSSKSNQQSLRVEQIGSINLKILIEPHGLITFLNSSDSVIINDFVRIGEVYPQQSIPNLNMESLANTFCTALYRQGVYGFVNLSLIMFPDSKTNQPLFWCKSFKLGLDEYISAIMMIDALSQSVSLSANNSMADVANDLLHLSSQKCFMYLPLLYHPQLAQSKYKELFAKCRKEGISFDMERKQGSLVLLCDEIKAGVLSLITIKETQRKSVKLMTDSLNFLLHFAGTVVKMQSENLRTDMFYFIDIVAKVRSLNKEYEKIEIKEFADKKILS